MKGHWRKLTTALMNCLSCYNSPQNKIYIYVNADDFDNENPAFKLVMVIQKRKMGWFYWYNWHHFQPEKPESDPTDKSAFVRTGTGDIRRIIVTKLKNCVTRITTDLNGTPGLLIYPPQCN